MTTEYNTLLKRPQWFEKRKIILARDNNKCRCCGVSRPEIGLHELTCKQDEKIR